MSELANWIPLILGPLGLIGCLIADHLVESGALDYPYDRYPEPLREQPANDNAVVLAKPDAITVPQLGRVVIRVQGDRSAA